MGGRRPVLWMLLLVGCGGGYQGGIVTDALGQPTQRGRQVGCVDLRVSALTDPLADPSWAVVGLDFGNRCDGPAPLDFTRLEVVAGYPEQPDGAPLRPFDPEGEIAPGVLDGHASGREVIAWMAEDTLSVPSWFCVQVADIGGGHGGVAPVCFDRVKVDKGAQWHVR